MFGGKNFINKPVRVEDMLKVVSEFAFDKQQAFERFVHVRVADTLRNKYASDFVKRTVPLSPEHPLHFCERSFLKPLLNWQVRLRKSTLP